MYRRQMNTGSYCQRFMTVAVELVPGPESSELEERDAEDL